MDAFAKMTPQHLSASEAGTKMIVDLSLVPCHWALAHAALRPHAWQPQFLGSSYGFLETALE